MNEKRAMRENDLLMAQWFRLHKIPLSQWQAECQKISDFNTLDEFISAVSAEHFGVDILGKEYERHSIKSKSKRLLSRALMLFRSALQR